MSGARTLASRVVDLGMARLGLIGGRALLFLVFGWRLAPDAYGAVAVMLVLANLFVVLLDLGLSMFLLREASRGAEATRRALPGLVVLRGVALLPVLGAYAAATRVLVGDTAGWSLTLAVGVWVLGLQIAQTVFLFWRGTLETAYEGRSTAALVVAEGVATGAWYLSGSSDPVPLFIALAVLRVVFVIALTVLAARPARSGQDVEVDLAATGKLLRAQRRSLTLYALLAVFQFVIAQSESITLQLLRPVEDVGQYFACRRVGWILLLPNELLFGASMPRWAAATHDADLTRRIYQGVHRLAAVVAVVVLVGGAVQRHALADLLLGPRLGPITDLFAWAVVASAVAWLPPFVLPLALDAEPRPTVVVYALGAAAAVAAQIVLVPRLGAVGAAYASIVGYAGLRLASLPLLARRGVPLVDAGALAPPVLLVGAWWAVGAVLELSAPVSLTALAVGSVALLAFDVRRNAGLIESAPHPAEDRAAGAGRHRSGGLPPP